MPKLSKSKTPVYEIETMDGSKVELVPDGTRFLLSLADSTNQDDEPIWTCAYITAEQLEAMAAFAKEHS